MSLATPESAGKAQPEPQELSPQDVADLAAAGRAGDRQAFERLVAKYHRLVFKIALNKSNNRSDAEDIVQEVFLHAFRSLPNLREPQAFFGWLMAIAHNRGNRYCRVRKAKIIALEEARKEMQEAQRLQQVESEEDSRQAELAELVRALPDDFRLALTWKYLEGLCYEEIGERLQLSFHQVDYLLRRAKNALRVAAERQQRQREGSASSDSANA